MPALTFFCTQVFTAGLHKAKSKLMIDFVFFDFIQKYGGWERLETRLVLSRLQIFGATRADRELNSRPYARKSTRL